MFIKHLISFTLLILIMALPSKFYGMEPLGDTGMFVNNTDMNPNVLIILDNSVDMAKQICDFSYSPSTNYCTLASGCNNSCPYVTNYVYYKPLLSNTWQLLTTSIATLQANCGSDVVNSLNTLGYYNPFDSDCTDVYGVHTICRDNLWISHCNLECDYPTCACEYRMVATGNYLNFKSCYTASGKNCQTRMSYAKSKIKEIVNTIGIDADAPAGLNDQRMRVGLMTFATVPIDQICRIFWCDNSEDTTCASWTEDNGVITINENQQCLRYYMGARIEAWVGMGYSDRDGCKDADDYDDLQRVLTEDTNFDLESNIAKGVPLAEALAEAGLYYSGQYSWSHQKYRNTSESWVTRTYTVPSYVDSDDASAYRSHFIVSSTDSTTRQYISPIRWRCQKNYIILITSGNPKARIDDGVYHAWYKNCAWDCIQSDAISSYNLFTGNQWRPDGCSGFMNVWNASNTQQCLSLTNEGTSAWDASDVAAFLYNNDIMGNGADGSDGNPNASCSRGDKVTHFNDADYKKQNVVTYVMGFADASAYGRDLMSRIAQKGGTGDFYSITDSADFDRALTEILTTIMKNSAEYVSPVVPVSRQNGVYAGDTIYLGQFKTASGVPWIGNLKKYGIDTDGNILQKNGSIATCCDVDGNCSYTSADVSCSDSAGNVYANVIKDTATSSWSDSADGNDVELGGAGKVVNNQAGNSTRRVYTSKYATSGLIDITSSQLTYSDFGVSSDAERIALVQFVTGEGYTGGVRTSFMGDIIHSKPAVMNFGNKNIIFVGDNSGQMHCFVDDLSVTAGGSSALTESWSFIPGEFLGKLLSMQQDRYPLYFVDGSATIHDVGTERLLTFGYRRGGGTYVTLKIGNLDTNGNYTGGYDSPSFKWTYPSISSGSGNIGSTTEPLGQSWLKPIVCKMMTSGGSTNAIILAGGYDDTAEDQNDPSTPNLATHVCTKGRGVYAVNAGTGDIIMNAVNTASFPITGSIVDIMSYDRTGDGNEDTIYAGDTNGNIYVFWNWVSTSTSGVYEDSTTWQSKRIFTGRYKGGAGMILKFFSAPDVVMENNSSFTCPDDSSTDILPYDYVFMGTGDREHPRAAEKQSGSKQTYDRMYAIRNFFVDYTACPSGPTSSTYTYPYYDNNLTHVTDYTASGYWYKTYTTKRSWYISFVDSDGDGVTDYGEKVVSQPIVYNGVMYFTTYVPPTAVYGKSCSYNCNLAENCNAADGWCKQDKCKPTELGTTRVYAVDYRNGNPVYSSEGTRDGVNTAFVKKDRIIAKGDGMSAQPTLIVTKDGPKILIATAKGILTIDTNTIKAETKGTKTYWMIK